MVGRGRGLMVGAWSGAWSNGGGMKGAWSNVQW